MKVLLKNISAMLSLLIFFVNICNAQSASPPAEGMNMDVYLKVLLVLMFILVNAIFIPLLRVSHEASDGLKPAKEKKKFRLDVIKEKLSGLQPMENERSLLLEGNYDGIRELDNKVPPWFNILFYGTIVIGVIYFLNYHVFMTGKLPYQEYYDEVYAADLQREELIRTGAFINENSAELLKDQESLNTGREIFKTNCVICHGENGQGTVGPNLTDEYWIHGGGIRNVFKTIKYGVPAKGMITWMNQFNPKKIEQVASYVISLQGTDPPGGKAPEGDRYVESSPDSSNTLKSDSLKKQTSVPDSSGAIQEANE